jgi:hypothetical protein
VGIQNPPENAKIRRKAGGSREARDQSFAQPESSAKRASRVDLTFATRLAAASQSGLLILTVAKGAGEKECEC